MPNPFDKLLPGGGASAKWVRDLQRAVGTPCCPVGDPAANFIPSKALFRAWVRELAAWLRLISMEMASVVLDCLDHHSAPKLDAVGLLGVQGCVMSRPVPGPLDLTMHA